MAVTHIDERELHLANARNLYADIFWWGLLAGSTLAFLPVFLARLNATGFQIGLMSAGPAVVNLLISLPAGYWLRGREAVRTTFWLSILHRAAFVLLIPLPWLFDMSQQIWAVLGLVLVSSVPATVIAISFNAMFADIVPPDMRTQVVGRRNALVAISITGTTFACGLLLDKLPFPMNYQLVYALGAVGAAMSSFYLARLKPVSQLPKRAGQPLLDLARFGRSRLGDASRISGGLRYLTRSTGASLFRPDLLRGPFGPFLLAYLLFYTFQNMPAPLFPLFMVDELNLTDGAISLGSGLFHAAMLLASLGLPRLTLRFNERYLLVGSTTLYAAYPLLLGLSRGIPLYLLASLVGGIIWGIANVCLVNLLMDRVPANDRPAHMALNNLAANLGVLLGSLAGPLLATYTGLRTALLVAAGLRLLAGLAIRRLTRGNSLI